MFISLILFKKKIKKIIKKVNIISIKNQIFFNLAVFPARISDDGLLLPLDLGKPSMGTKKLTQKREVISQDTFQFLFTIRTFIVLQIHADYSKAITFNQKITAAEAVRVFALIAGNIAAVNIF